MQWTLLRATRTTNEQIDVRTSVTYLTQKRRFVSALGEFLGILFLFLGVCTFLIDRNGCICGGISQGYQVFLAA